MQTTHKTMLKTKRKCTVKNNHPKGKIKQQTGNNKMINRKLKKDMLSEKLEL